MDCTRQIEEILWEVWHELMRLVGQKLQIFADALEVWINTLLQKPLPADWREQLAQFLAVWDAVGYEVLPEHVRGLENWIEAWARMRGVLPKDATHPTNSAVNEPTTEPRSVTESDEFDKLLSQREVSEYASSRTTSLSPIESDIKTSSQETPSQALSSQQFFDSKQADAQACLDEIWRELQALGFKLDIAKVDDAVDVDSEVDRIDDLIWRYNDALESARDTWLREKLDGEAYEFFHAITVSEAEAILQGLLESERPALEAMQSTAEIDGVQFDYSLSSLPDVLKWMFKHVRAHYVPLPDSEPAWIRQAHPDGLLEFDEDSKPIILRAVYYLGECFARLPGMRWTTGDVAYMEKNMPVVAGFHHDLELAPLVVVDNLFARILGDRGPLTDINAAIDSWMADCPSQSHGA